jgi:hypothetical protein
LPRAGAQPVSPGATLHALLTHYRDRCDNNPLQDRYPSFEACSKATGIPLKVLNNAKRLGCPALRRGRVELAPFLMVLRGQRTTAHQPRGRAGPVRRPAECEAQAHDRAVEGRLYHRGCSAPPGRRPGPGDPQSAPDDASAGAVPGGIAGGENRTAPEGSGGGGARAVGHPRSDLQGLEGDGGSSRADAWWPAGSEGRTSTEHRCDPGCADRERVSPESHWTPGGWTA